MAFVRNPDFEEKDKAVAWLFWTALIAIAALYILMLLSLPIGTIIGQGLSRETLAESAAFIKRAVMNPSFLIGRYWAWFKGFMRIAGTPNLAWYFPMLPFISFVLIGLIGAAMNPYSFMPTTFGGGRKAEYADIKKMKLFNGFIIVLGKFRGKLLKLPETLSVLAVAPPGTGKTVSIVVPTILEAKGISIIVNDPKPELCYLTTGYRATEGPVFVINWGAEDDPAKNIYYPSWNPLSAVCLPPMGPARDMYIDSMVAVLVEEPKGGADPHWSKTGRNAMAGFLHFISSKCERARANDYFVNTLMEGRLNREDAAVLETYYLDMPDVSAKTALDTLRRGEMTSANYLPIGTWEGLPEYWHGAEPCIAMILDWLNDTQMKIAADIKRRIDEGDQMAALADPMRDTLDLAVAECKRFGYAQRAMLEMNQLASTPDKERGSILSTALTGIGVFKNAAVRARTKYSDFTFRDLRGMRDPITGEMKPISIYLSVNQVDARALSVITGIFVELMSSFLIANPPNFIGSDGIKSGPYPVLFVLDEFPQMPKLAAVKDGPAVGRGQKVSYLLIGQDLGQISGQYGKDDLETIITTTAAKIVLAQNNEQTAQRFEKMIGSKTIEVKSSSRTEGWSKASNPFAANISRSLQSSSVIGASEMMSLPKTKQIVIMQGFLNRPIMADSPRWFLDPKMKKKCSMPPSEFVPFWAVAQREVIQSPKIADVASELKALKDEDSDYTYDEG